MSAAARPTGRVALVGAGPGDPGLLTARALELISQADAILYDRLIPPGALDGARPDAELVYVGKEGGGPAVPQAEIDALLVEHGRRGGLVVRLKGGDPFVFGRGGEEALVLREAGIPFEVVPGITAGIAGPAYAGIPVTHRDRASGVAFVTGHEDPAKPESAIDWPALAAFPGTLVFYMGVRQLPRIAAQLVAGGRPADEPAAIVERGTQPAQRTVTGTLADIAERAADAAIRAPAVTVVGPVATLADQLDWRPPRPLLGRRVVVTRARAQASGLAARLRALGADVIEAPAIRTRALDTPVPDLAAYDLLVLTSANGVRRLFEQLGSAGRDARALTGPRIAAIGAATTRALAEHGIVPDVVPERAIAESLLDALADLPVRRALIARAAVARETLPDGLRARGAEVEVLPLYETLPEPLEPAALDAARGADCIAFTSASTVTAFLAAAGGPDALGGPDMALASIGPITSAALREQGLEPAFEATRHDVDGLLDAIVTGLAPGADRRM